MVQQVHCSQRRLLWSGPEFHVCTINKCVHMKKSLKTYLMILLWPKIHKDKIPLRPIVSHKGSACHQYSHFLVEIVTPLMSKLSSVKNAANFMEKISNAPIYSNQMVSLDVLFTRVPNDETLIEVQDKLAFPGIMQS